MSDLSDDDIADAKALAREVQTDPDANPQAKAYASALVDGRSESAGLAHAGSRSRGIETQLRYLQGNVSDDRAQQIADILGESADDGYTKGYCTVCGNRDNENAAHPGTDADGLVCVGCYDDFGEPNECDRCSTTTYEGDKMVSGDHEGKWFCDDCLMKIPTGPPGDFL